MESRVIAGRYRLAEQFAAGAFGRVFRASDRLTDRTVAVKLMPPLTFDARERLRAEISALRLLRVAGIARLLDEGLEDGEPFIVMELAEGEPFPGPVVGGVWSDIRYATVSLLETLARVHAAGVIHRDLKPGNVLVDAAGRTTVLDFGLSAGRAIGAGLEDSAGLTGTLRYAAPEQLRGERPDVRSDLYSVGVMVYEALSGAVPHDGLPSDEFVTSRLHGTVPSLGEVAPGTPTVVVRVIDALLARDQADRPRSAAGVLAQLSGEVAALSTGTELPRLGGDELIDRVSGAALDGSCVEVHGPPGTGRTRLLFEAARALEEQGRRVVWATPADSPFGSLAALAEWSDDDCEPSDLEAAIESTDRCLARALAAGVILFVDDPERLDRFSRDTVERGREGGVVVSTGALAGGVRVELGPLPEAALRPLFAGPERIFHLRTDGARELWARTRGVPKRIAGEVDAWVRAGIAQWSGRELVVDHGTLSLLEAGARILPHGGSPGDEEREPASEDLRQLVACIELAAPNASTNLLATVTEDPQWLLEAQLDELVAEGAARRYPDGSYEALVGSSVIESWGADRRAEVHARIARALDPGTPGRLRHLISAGTGAEIADEAIRVAREYSREGRLEQAVAALRDGTHEARVGGDWRGELELLEEWTKTASGMETSQSIDQVLYELSRTMALGESVRHLEALLRAWLATKEMDGERGRALADAVEPFEDVELDNCRQIARVMATRDSPLEDQEALIEELEEWVAQRDSDELRANLALWKGRLRYRQARYEEATQLYAEAAKGKKRVAGRLSAMLNCGSALLETMRPREALDVASEALELAVGCRHTFYIGRSEWLKRAATYRSGLESEPDLELVEAIGRVGDLNQEGLVCVNEAAVAWRSGDVDLARELALRSSQSWTILGHTIALTLTRALAIACGATATPEELEDLAVQIAASRAPRIEAQAAALLVMSGVDVREDWAALVSRIAEEMPPEQHAVRMDVLAFDEILRAVGGVRASGG